ncbi:ABC transporter permease [Myxococcota bacterium]|nr:ABC transporter permease [Myxococcota bacterium]
MTPIFLLVATREFRERVLSRAYLLSTLLFPVLVLASVLLPSLLIRGLPSEARTLVVVDEAPLGVAAAVVEALAEPGSDGADGEGKVTATVRRAPLADVEEGLRADLAAERIDGYLWLPPDVADSGHVSYRARNVSNFQEMARIEAAVNDAVRQLRLASVGLSRDQAEALFRRVRLDAVRLGRDGQEGGGAEATFFVGFAISFALYMVIVLYGSLVMLSALEEKTSRVVEVVLSSIDASHLMAGKVLGIGAAALLQVGIWTVAGLTALAAAAPLALALSLPPGALDALRIAPGSLAAMLAYMLLGFFLYAAVFAAIGASVNTQQEAQQFAMLPTMILVVPLMMAPAISAAPDGALALTLSHLPFTSPLVMPARLGAADVAAWEVALSLALLVAATAGVAWLAGRIYRVGVLATGSRPGARELWRWVRHG